MNVRNATEKDLPELLELIRKGLGDEEAEEGFVRAQLAKLPPEREAVLVADDDGKACGFIHVEVYSNLYFGPVGNVLGLAVSEAHRRKGFATALLKAAEDWTKGKGCIGMRLNSGGTRHGAHDFYRAQGYNDEKTQLRFLKMY